MRRRSYTLTSSRAVTDFIAMSAVGKHIVTMSQMWNGKRARLQILSVPQGSVHTRSHERAHHRREHTPCRTETSRVSSLSVAYRLGLCILLSTLPITAIFRFLFCGHCREHRLCVNTAPALLVHVAGSSGKDTCDPRLKSLEKIVLSYRTLAPEGRSLLRGVKFPLRQTVSLSVLGAPEKRMLWTPHN